MHAGVAKATNTACSYFDDLAAGEPEAQNMLTVNKRIKSVRPRDNDSLASSASRQSKKLKNAMMAARSLKQNREDEGGVFTSLKKSLASLSEEASSSKGGMSGDFKSPVKIGQFSRGNSREASAKDGKLLSPQPNHKNLMASMQHISQSMDHRNQEGQEEEEMESGLDKNGRPRNAKPRSRNKKRISSNASTPRNKSERKNFLDSLGEMKAIPEASAKIQASKRKGAKAAEQKVPSWSISQNKGASLKADRLTITLLKTVTWKPRPMYAKGRMDSVVQRSLVNTDSFKPWPGKSSNEDIVSMQASGKIRSKDNSSDRKPEATVKGQQEASQATTIKGVTGKQISAAPKEKPAARVAESVRRGSRKLKDVLGSASENPRHMATLSNRHDTEDSFFKSRVDRGNRPVENEEQTTLKTIQENTATNLTWNHRLASQPRKPGGSLERSENRTFNGSLARKPHLDLEHPYTKQPTKYLDHLEDSHETIKKAKVSKMDTFIEQSLRADRKQRGQQGDLHTRLYQDGLEAAGERRKRQQMFAEGAAQEWEERHLRKRGVLCRLR